jgi:GH15 family glucan-1,4-alpha-glucosidase
MRLESLALVGNCQCAALVSSSGDIVWCCLPRFDSEPVFGQLLDEGGGAFSVGPPDGSAGVQQYLTNTNVLETRFTTPAGTFRVVDFVPRFAQHGRYFRPTQIHRIVEAIDGSPRVRVHCDPRLGWSKRKPAAVAGSNHIQFEEFPAPLRLTTDIPLSYLDGRPFALTGRHHLVLTWGAPIEEPLAPLVSHFRDETIRYWQQWVKHCSIPPQYQNEVIRSALALKLHCFDDTGAIVASTTTSLPEAPGSGRTWDYRYCWLRDAYYALSAFRLIGHFEEREKFLLYLIDVAANNPSLELAPLYRVDGRSDLDETILTEWRGYAGERPVRVGNAAAAHLQHDVFGEMILALTPIYVDERFSAERSPGVLELMVRIARKAVSVAGTPDAGIWEYREAWRPQTFSSVMCWAAAEQMARIVTRHAPELYAEFRGAADRIRAEIMENAWNADASSFVGSYGSAELDASLLQLAVLRFLPPGDTRLRSTIERIRRELKFEGWIKRYNRDPMGKTEVAFTVCTFWLVEALARIGEKQAARETFERALEMLSPVGLISEDYDPLGRRMWGNFPQAYSHVGLIHAAFAASPGWVEVI